MKINNLILKRVVNFFHPFFILYFFLLASPAVASYNFTSKVEKAYGEFLKLKLSNGEKLIKEALREDPNNGVAILVEDFGETISLFISEDQKKYTELKSNEDKRIKKIAALAKNSSYYKFIQAEIKLHWAFVKLKFGDEVSAGWNARQAYKLLEENYKAYPDFEPTKKSLGLLYVVFGSIPDKYGAIINLAGIKSDVQEGIKLLEEISKSDSPFALEAELYKILAENYILKNGDPSLKNIQGIYQKHPDNLLLSFMYAALLMKNARCDDALTVLKNRPSSSEHVSFPYLDFLAGEIYLFKADYAQSKKYYDKFLTSYAGKNLIKDSYYKLFLNYWLNNEDATAKTYLPKILNNGQTFYDSDKYAQKFAEKNELPEKTIMRARLYFDGGYFQQALKTINTFNVAATSNQKDIIEYNYRKGRIYHQLGNYSQAIILYLKTIELSKNVNYYFAPNSALQMGYIYKDQNNRELARIYFNKALTYQNYEYKNSIDTKAKAALNELKKKN